MSAPIAFTSAFVTGTPANSLWSFGVAGRSMRARVLNLGDLDRRIVTVYDSDNQLIARGVTRSNGGGKHTRTAIAEVLRAARLA